MGKIRASATLGPALLLSLALAPVALAAEGAAKPAKGARPAARTALR
mgnify:CR=1 FL=1